MEIKISKGADVKLRGEAEKRQGKKHTVGILEVKPTDFLGLTPKLVVKAGERVKRGTALFFDKNAPEVKFTAPMGGEVLEIKRGEKRKVLAVKIKVDEKADVVNFGKLDLSVANPEEIKKKLQESGMWPFILQRPYATIADVNSFPKAIFITATSTSPLSPCYDYLLEGKAALLQVAIDVLSCVTKNIYFNIHSKAQNQFAQELTGVNINTFSGLHPSGNAGVHINKILPVNKGEVVWVINALDLVSIGKFFKTGEVDFTKTVAIAGGGARHPEYFETVLGADLSNVFENQMLPNSRCISGDVFTGSDVGPNGTLGFYDYLLTIIPERKEDEFLGWSKPQFNKLSFSRTNVSWLFPNKKYNLDTGINGEERAFVTTGEYEKFFPMDIYPVYLLKAMITKNIEMMEKLGAYEVAPEDFALCEFACTSKIPVQKIVREALLLMKKELS